MVPDPSYLLLQTLDELERRIASSEPYEILMAAGLLRKLFLDRHSLVDQINRKEHLKLRFHAVPTQVTPPGRPRPSLYSAQDGIDPDTSLSGRTPVDMTRAEFFGMTVLSVEAKEYSVADIIRFEANIMGAVHAGQPSDEDDRKLAEVSALFGIGGYEPALRQLKAIGRVVAKALQPLRARTLGAQVHDGGGSGR